jgi:hypothetical protein
MNQPPMFVPECWVDTALMRTLLHDRRLYNHQHGISKVGGTMERQAATFGPTRVVVGMVDRDKKFEENEYLRAFGPPARVRPEAATHHLLTHPQQPTQCLIVLNPACDAWVFRAAQAAGLALADYDLPAALPDFIRFCKHRSVTDIPELRALLEAIRRANPPAYKQLAEAVAGLVVAGTK